MKVRWEKQFSIGPLGKRCSENIQQIYRKTPMPKDDFNKVARQLFWNQTFAEVFSYKFVAYSQNTFSWEHRWRSDFEWETTTTDEEATLNKIQNSSDWNVSVDWPLPSRSQGRKIGRRRVKKLAEDKKILKLYWLKCLKTVSKTKFGPENEWLEILYMKFI